jgi:hypothetical protein
MLLEELHPGTKLSNWPGPLPLADLSVLLTTLRNTPPAVPGHCPR